MTAMDESTRLAGRVNVIDIAVALTVVLLLPGAIGAYLIFRNPPPKLSGINPARLYEGNNRKVEIAGRDLRPFMRVSFNDVQGRSFLINTPTSALVDLPELKSGVYDVVLYDYRQEVDRMPKAFTIMPVPFQPTLEVELEGAFVGLTEPLAKEIVVGLKFPPSGRTAAEVLAVAPIVPGHLRLRAGETVLTVPTQELEVATTLRASCVLTGNPDGTAGCTSFGTDVAVPFAAGTAVSYPGPHGWIRYQISAVHPPASTRPTVDARVRFVGAPELLALMKVGDVDTGPFASAALRHATLTAVGSPRAATAGEAAIDAALRVPIDRAGAEWRYMNKPFKAGAALTFETARYIVQGDIVSVGALPAIADKP
jgi:hypothetical protein